MTPYGCAVTMVYLSGSSGDIAHLGMFSKAQAFGYAKNIKRGLGKIKLGHGIILDGLSCSKDVTIALLRQKTSNNHYINVVIRGLDIV